MSLRREKGEKERERERKREKKRERSKETKRKASCELRRKERWSLNFWKQDGADLEASQNRHFSLSTLKIKI